jgi:hypothetical protein
MKQDTQKTEVIFRVDTTKDYAGAITAIFPYQVETYKGNVGMYAHVGQHGHGDYQTMLGMSRPAGPEEYNDLKKEMENNYGYNFKVIQRRNYDKYLKEYKRVNGYKN